MKRRLRRATRAMPTLRVSPVFDWWLRGWRALLPERWLQALRQVPDRVTIERLDETLRFRRYAGPGGELLEERVVALDDQPARDGVNDWLRRQGGDLSLVLLLPPEKQLRQAAGLPPGR